MSTEPELSILSRRRAELLARRAEAQAIMSEVDKELALNDATGDYLARLTGAAWPPAGEANPVAAPSPHNRVLKAETGAYRITMGNVTLHAPPHVLTWPEMISVVLAEAKAEGFDGLSPADMRDRIAAKFGAVPPKGGISPTAWRLEQKGRLVKIRDGVYAEPDNKKASDLLSREDQSEADVQPSAQGGEARPGGGT